MDKSLFSAACSEHRAFLVALAMRLTRRDYEASQDLVQDCMMKAWVAWDTVVVPPEHSVYSAQRAWLSRILANVFVSKYRRQRQHDAALTTHLAAVVDGVCPNAEVAPTRVGVEPTYSQPAPVTLDLTGDEVLAAVSSLPANQREVVQRYYFDNEPMPDIAVAMGNSLSCTHKLAFRARIALAKSLSRYARENYRMVSEPEAVVETDDTTAANRETYSAAAFR